MTAPPPLNEIRSRAMAFAKEWAGETSESAESQTFWNEFLAIFGIHRRRVAAFEVNVQLLEGGRGKIDLFWPGVLLVEHKSAGKDLTAAFKQGAEYFHGLEDKDLPKFVVVSDFARFRVYNLDDHTEQEFELVKLHQHIGVFAFLTGHTARPYAEATEVNIEAAGLMADLHAALLKNGYSGHKLAVLLVRLMFCFFADKTGIFQTGLFRNIIEQKTRKDGSDVGPLLMHVFGVLDTPQEKRQTNLDPDLAELEYVNGHLFDERFDAPAFDAAARDMLLECAAFDWSTVSPAIFGAMFQGVMDEERGRRRQIGAHYTSEKNILKCIGPALIDPLREEFEKATSRKALEVLLKKIASVRVLDPACGCGNFLVIAYRELRQLEIEIHDRLQEMTKRAHEPYLSVEWMAGLNVDAMYGIEIEDFPCRVAETALYIMDHMMNNSASERFGENFRRLPLSKTPHITHGNALQLNWATVVKAGTLTAIVGNPPFIGKTLRTAGQAADMRHVFGEGNGYGELDYIAAWYAKAAEFVRGTTIRVAFVSTNSLTQGEQVASLWPKLLASGVRIRFAHRTFRWDNGAPGEASVYCVIIGWSIDDSDDDCLLYDYETPRSDPLVRRVRRINPYLVDADDVFVAPRRNPLCPVPRIAFGSMPNEAKPRRKEEVGEGWPPFELRSKDQLLLTTEEKKALVREEPRAAKWIRRLYGAEEFLHGAERWCLWMVGITAAELNDMPLVKRRVRVVKANRLASKRSATQRLAETPWLFGEIRQPSGDYLLIPSVSSEDRPFIPMGFMPARAIASNLVLTVAGATLYHFGVLQSTMHMAWMRQVCGRLEARYRYSNEIVYNNFPWPDSPSDRQMEAVQAAARGVLDARAAHKGQTLADLYDADVMPAALRKAHRVLDKAVDACYGPAPGGKSKPRFDTELSRVKYLFEWYAKLIANGQMSLPGPEPTKKKRRRRRAP